MSVLEKDLRNRLEMVVIKAREVGEAGARAALEALAVDAAAPFGHMDVAARELRVRLRAHARQLGDKLEGKGKGHGIEHLVVECAYEHWHRMLFARFLAENRLLMHPDGVAVTLAECEGSASDEGAADGWELAGRYAARMLPAIFRPEDPVLRVRLAPEHEQALEGLLKSLLTEVFTADDSLGWVYQFWQTKRKDEVNKAEKKIGAEELPAVTQLFTEHYMVLFLLHNTLGAWWGAASRRRAAVRDGVSAAAGGRDAGGGDVRRVADGVCRAEGPGPLLRVGAFPDGGAGDPGAAADARRRAHRPASRRQSSRREHFNRLEIDPRCTQLAVFNLALTAWRFPGAQGYRELPIPHVACSGIAPNAKREDWLALAGKDERLRNGMGRLYELFQDAPTLGSLIDPRREAKDGDLLEATWEELQPLLEEALATETGDYELQERALTAKGIADAAYLLSVRYTLVITNVPYLKSGSQVLELREMSERLFPASRSDLAAVFLERSVEVAGHSGAVGLVAPLSWLYQPSYERLRLLMLGERRWHSVARLGPGAFETISGEVVNVGLFILSCGTSAAQDSSMQFVDALDADAPHNKAEIMREGGLRSVSQLSQLTNPNHIVTFESRQSGELIGSIASSIQGIKTGDDPRFRRVFWELLSMGPEWRRFQSTVGTPTHFGGLHGVLSWTDEGNASRPPAGSRCLGQAGCCSKPDVRLRSSDIHGGCF